MTSARNIPSGSRRTRVLLWNVSYGLGWDGSAGDAARWSRCIRCPERVRAEVSRRVAEVIASVDPDVCCLLEVTPDLPLLGALGGRYPHLDCAVKYAARGVLARLPFFRTRCNAVLAREPLPVRRHELHAGRKRLFHEVELPGAVSLWAGHCALGRGARSRQIAEIARLLRPDRRHVVCADFNAFDGDAEFAPLAAAGLALLPFSPTYPACSPRHALDRALHSCGISVLPVAIPGFPCPSDHLPLCFDIGA